MYRLAPTNAGSPSSRTRTRTLIVLALLITVAGWALLSNIHLDPSLQIQEEQQQQGQTLEQTLSNPNTLKLIEDDYGVLEPAVSLLDPDTRYLSFLSFAGLTNQIMGLETAALLAQELNRTLILPPITPNIHMLNNTHQRWSQFFDIPRFTNTTGIKVVEWDLIRPLTPEQKHVGRDQALLGAVYGRTAETPAWSKVAENITCEIICGYGSDRSGLNIVGSIFLWHFLFRPILQGPRPWLPGMQVFKNTKVYENDLEVLGDVVQRYKDVDTHVLWLSHVYHIKDRGHNIDRRWLNIGQYFHFVPQIMDFTTTIVNQELEKDYGVEEVVNDDPEEQVDPLMEMTDKMTGPTIANTNMNATESGDLVDPTMNVITAPLRRIPHIAIHLRRGDIASKCRPDDRDNCMIPFEFYVDAVARARTIAAGRGLISRLPVIVTTDSKDEEDFRQIKALGWHRIDHDKYETVKLWGSFGPAMVDSAILAHADGFVGSGKSSMTRIAASRQGTWYHHEVVYPIVPQSHRRKRELVLESRGNEAMEDVRIVF